MTDATPAGRQPPSHRALWPAFATLYVVWGSTYLAIRYAVQTIPPYLMAGGRFLVSGIILYIWARRRGSPSPSRLEWRDAAIVGALLLCAGNGAVGWAEQRVPSGITALLVASVPLWMVLLDWVRPKGTKPPLVVGLGLIIGLFGVAWLALPGWTGSGHVNTADAAMLLFGSISWAGGSIYSRQGAHPASAEMATGIQMITGSVALILVAAAMGEFSGFHPSQVSLVSFVGWSYLVTFGALLGFTAYIFLLRETTPAKASTYAYVNPVIAVALGWAIAGEPVTMQTLAAAAIIIASVAVITLAGGARGS
jgi:drug/metabolite transporter (DMT)-like permease